MRRRRLIRSTLHLMADAFLLACLAGFAGLITFAVMVLAGGSID